MKLSWKTVSRDELRLRVRSLDRAGHVGMRGPRNEFLFTFGTWRNPLLGRSGGSALRLAGRAAGASSAERQSGRRAHHRTKRRAHLMMGMHAEVTSTFKRLPVPVITDLSTRSVPVASSYVHEVAGSSR